MAKIYHRNNGSIWILAILVASGLMAIYFGAAKAEVRSQETEAYCLSCHSNRDLKMTLPSGEELPLYISPEHLQQSIHSPLGIECEACHTNITTYPHPPIRPILLITYMPLYNPSSRIEIQTLLDRFALTGFAAELRER